MTNPPNKPENKLGKAIFPKFAHHKLGREWIYRAWMRKILNRFRRRDMRAGAGWAGCSHNIFTYPRMVGALLGFLRGITREK